MFNPERNNTMTNEPFKIDMYFTIKYYAKKHSKTIQDVPSMMRIAELGHLKKVMIVYATMTLTHQQLTNIEQQ